jgi:hypothetical protein
MGVFIYQKNYKAPAKASAAEFFLNSESSIAIMY